MRCVIDDFNNVRRASERIRVVEANVGSGERREFNQFISDMGVDGIPINGRRFTCCRLNGKAISRLDRMLVSRKRRKLRENLLRGLLLLLLKKKSQVFQNFLCH